jgi:hypothetical protein
MWSLYTFGSFLYLLGSLLFTLAALLEGQGSLSATHAGNVLFVLGSVCFVRDGLRASAARQAQSTRGENGGACTHSPGLVQP